LIDLGCDQIMVTNDDNPSYSYIIKCMKLIKEILKTEELFFSERKKLFNRKLLIETKVPAFLSSRAKERKEDEKVYTFRKNIINTFIESGKKSRMEEFKKRNIDRKKENKRISDLNNILTSLTQRQFVVEKDLIETTLHPVSGKRDKVKIAIMINAPELSLLSDIYEINADKGKYKRLKKNQKHFEIHMKFHLSKEVLPKLLDISLYDRKAEKKEFLTPLYEFIPRGCFYKSWHQNKTQSERRSEITENSAPEEKLYCVNDFYAGRYEITKGEYIAFSGEKNVPLDMIDHPVTFVDWQSAMNYCRSLGKKYGGKYRLPARTEWEYVASIIGADFKYVTGKNLIEREEVNIRGLEEADTWEWTSPVGTFMPKDLGIYDMGGNTYEWVTDWADGRENENEVLLNYSGPSGGKYKYIMGGGWSSDESELLFSNRRKWTPLAGNGNIGFRCVRESESGE